MATKEKLEAFFDTEKNGLKLIEKYEENIVFFNNLLESGHEEDVEFVISIKVYNYAFSLQFEGFYNKAFSIACEIEKDLEKLKVQLECYEIYLESITFLKGVCLGRLRKYRESNKYFKQLVEKTPTNDRYIDWYKLNKGYQIEKISNVIAIVALSIYILYFVLSITNIISFKIPKIIGTLALLIMMTTWAVSYIWIKIINKQRLKLNANQEKE